MDSPIHTDRPTSFQDVTVDEALGMSPEQRRIRFYLTNEFGLLVLIFVFGIAFTLVTPRFLSHFNLFILGRTAAVNIVVGFSMMVVIVTGGLDLSVGSIGVCAAMAGG